MNKYKHVISSLNFNKITIKVHKSTKIKVYIYFKNNYLRLPLVPADKRKAPIDAAMP